MNEAELTKYRFECECNGEIPIDFEPPPEDDEPIEPAT